MAIKYEKRDGVAYITLNNPAKANIFDKETSDEISKGAAAVSGHPAVGVDDDLAPGEARCRRAGPPSSKRPVGLTRSAGPRVEVGRQQRVDHVLDEVG